MKENTLATKGRIFNIQRFSVHDGPGIRTIVFLKGCVLRCKWCCNPESQKFEIETMVENGVEKTVGYDVTVGEVMKTVMKDVVYYRRSGGGITLSGGECLCQGEFARALLKAAKENGISTAIESAATVSYDVIESLLPFLDLYLMDIKHINSEKHKQFTGKGNEVILENARKVAENAKKLIVRVPVVPTFNDTEEEILQIAEFARSLKTVEEIHLLPYHNFGMVKYEGLGREYLMGDIKPPENEKMLRLKSVAEKSGLKVQIGG